MLVFSLSPTHGSTGFVDGKMSHASIAYEIMNIEK